ncbi:hypothetical protein Sjap_022452 [Stephania japonica]|uniref:Uncharacterized protein n=1 Tax=Stephania japonica TaxID=461633 RepID=A0AAP0ENX2_9MAGN
MASVAYRTTHRNILMFLFSSMNLLLVGASYRCVSFLAQVMSFLNDQMLEEYSPTTYFLPILLNIFENMDSSRN